MIPTFDKLANFITKHPKSIIAIWIVALLVALPFAMQSGNVLDYDMTTMSGSESESTIGLEIMDENFNSGVSTNTIMVIPYGSSDDLTLVAGMVNATNGLQEHLDEHYGTNAVIASDMGAYNKNGDSSVSGIYLIGITFNDSDLNTVDETANIRTIVDQTTAALGIEDHVYVTGSSAITYDTKTSATDDISKIDPFSILLIIILLGLFFWAIVTAGVPPATVGMAYGLVLALLFFIGGVLDIFYITSIIVLVSMLGAGCDYSIFIISRYREERLKGLDKESALKEAIRWAGVSVATSGLAVIIGFGVMSFCSFSLVQTMGMILALGIVMALLAALTFIPALLELIGDRVFWPSNIDAYREGSKTRKGIYGKFVSISRRYFGWVGRFSVKHAIAIVAVALLVTAPLGYVALTTESSYDMISIMPDSDAKEGVNLIVDDADGGMLMPTYAVFELTAPIATLDHSNHTLLWTTEGYRYLDDLDTMSSELSGSDENINYILGPTPWASVYSMVYQSILAAGVPAESITPQMVNTNAVTALPELIQPTVSSILDEVGWDNDYTVTSPYIDYALNYGGGTVSSDGNMAKLTIMLSDEPMSDASMDSISGIRSMIEGYDDEYSSMITESWVTGTAVVVLDVSDTVNSEFNWIKVMVILLIFVLLFFVLGSYLTPIRSLLTIIMSIMWTIGMTHLVFSTALGIPVTWIVPIVLFVVCLGLGMDYDILLTTRIREAKKKGMTNDDAIVNAMEKSGSTISLCGMIMGGTFLTLLVSSSPMLQEFGFALGFAILVDSLIVITYIVPALMHLMGDWSWKGPKFLNRG
ncbi:MAG: MMPL family transporter [Candidatus Methanomethylophilaceae archaeon]